MRFGCGFFVQFTWVQYCSKVKKKIKQTEERYMNNVLFILSDGKAVGQSTQTIRRCFSFEKGKYLPVNANAMFETVLTVHWILLMSTIKNVRTCVASRWRFRIPPRELPAVLPCCIKRSFVVTCMTPDETVSNKNVSPKMIKVNKSQTTSQFLAPKNVKNLDLYTP